MPTPLEIINALGTPAPRMPVTVYRPRAVAPTRRTNAPPQTSASMHRREGRVDWDAVEQAALSTPAAKKRAMERAQEEAPKQEVEGFWGSPFGKGLGFAVNNPVVRPFLTPLNYLATGGRAVTLGAEELAERVPQAKALPVIGQILGGIDTERTSAEGQPSNWAKVFSPESDYGWGKILKELPEDAPFWQKAVRAGTAFGMDVISDPLTYVSPSPTRLVAAGRAAPEVAEAATKVDDLTRVVREAGEAGDHARMLEAANQLPEARRAYQAAYWEDQAARPVIEAPIHGGRKARRNLVAELSETAPWTLQGELGQELLAGTRRGLGALGPEARSVLGVTDPSLKFMGAPIPGTRAIAGGYQRLAAPIRAGYSKLPGGFNALDRGVAGTEEAVAAFRGKNMMDPLKAATTLRMAQIYRLGKEVEGLGNASLRELDRELGHLDPDSDAARTLLREAETKGSKNRFNEFIQGMLGIYRDTTGRSPHGKYLLDEESYVPHLLRPEFRRFLAANANDETVKQFMEHMKKGGFYQSDLMEGSSFLEKGRRLKPDVIGEPKDFEIAGKTITLTDGTIEELNNELRKVFPAFEGKFYEDNPIKIGEAYVSSLSRQAGRDLALQRMARSANPLVEEVSGELEAALRERNRILAQSPIVDAIERGFKPGETVPKIGEREQMPETIGNIKLSDYFGNVRGKKASAARRTQIIKQGRAFVDAVRKDVTETGRTIAESVKGIRTNLMDRLGASVAADNQLLKALERDAKNLGRRLGELGPVTSENMDEVVALRTSIEAQLSDLNDQIAKETKNYGRLETKAKNAKLRQLQQTKLTYEDLRDEAEAAFSRAPKAMREEAQQRFNKLMDPVRAAKGKLRQAEDAARARYPKAPDATTVAKARGEVYGSVEVDPAEAEKWAQAARQVQAQRTVDGSLTDETVEAVEASVRAQTVAEEAAKPRRDTYATRALPPEAQTRMESAAVSGPPPAAATPEPAAVAPEAAPTPELPPEVPVVQPGAKWERVEPGYWVQPDGASIVKLSKDEFAVTFPGDESPTQIYESLNEAKQAVDDVRVTMAEAAPPEATVAPVAEEAGPPPEVTPEPPPSEAPKPKAKEAPPMPKRKAAPTPVAYLNAPQTPAPKLTWKRSGNSHVAGNWEVRKVPRTIPKWDAEGRQLTKGYHYITLNSETGETLKRSFRTLDEAKQAVETHVAPLVKTKRDINMQGPRLATEAPAGKQPVVREALTEEQQAAVDAAAAVPNKPPPTPRQTGEGLRAGQPAPKVSPYEQDWARMKRLEAALAETEPTSFAGGAMSREYRDLHKEFYSKQGKYYSQRQARKTLAEHAYVETRVFDETFGERLAVQKARETAAQQVEAVTYAKLENSNQWLRVLGSEAGFGAGEERRAVLPQPPFEPPRPELRAVPDIAEEATPPLTEAEEVLGPRAAPQPGRRPFRSEDVQTVRSAGGDVTKEWDRLAQQRATLTRKLEAHAAAAARVAQLEALGDSPLQQAMLNQVRKDLMTPNDLRRAQGTLNAVEVAQRDMLHDFGGAGRQDYPLPEGVFERAEGSERVTPRGEPRARPATGQTPEQAQAYVESLQPTIPDIERQQALAARGPRRMLDSGQMVPVDENGNVIGGVRPYEPGTEAEAVQQLRREAQNLETYEQSAEGQALRAKAEGYKGKIAETEERIKAGTEVEAKGAEVRAQAAAQIDPMVARSKTQQDLVTTLQNRESLIPKRDAAKAQRTRIAKTRATMPPKYRQGMAEGAMEKWNTGLLKSIDEIEDVARQNPDLLDQPLTTVESLLQSNREGLTRLQGNDMTAQVVQQAIDEASSKKGVDLLLTTVGNNWKTMYEQGQRGKAILDPGDYIMQADLHRMFQNLYEIRKEPTLFGRTFNAFTNLFKTYATLSPGFHFRNALSAIFMNSVDGVALSHQYRAAGLWRAYRKGGATWLRAQDQAVQDAFRAVFASGAGGRFTEAGFAEVGTGAPGWMNRLERLQHNKLTRLSQRAGERVEGSVRLGMALDSIAKGESVESALDRITRIHFDYSELSELDAQAKRIIPFWTFMSRNLPMQVSEMWMKPRGYMIYQDFVNNVSAENEEYTPEYWTDAGAWNTGLNIMPGGDPLYIQPDLGFTRVQSDVADLEQLLSGENPGGILQSFNPLLTAPAEYALKQNFYTGQRYKDTDYEQVNGLLGPVITNLAKVLGQEKNGMVSDRFMNLLSAPNPLQSRSERLLPQVTGGNDEAVRRQFESWLRFGGAPVRQLTPKQQQNEFWRQYYDLRDEFKTQQILARKAAEAQAG